MTAEDLLQLSGTLTINVNLLAEIVLAFVGGFQHGSQSILGTVARTRTQRIKHTGGEYWTERQTLITL